MSGEGQPLLQETEVHYCTCLRPGSESMSSTRAGEKQDEKVRQDLISRCFKKCFIFLFANSVTRTWTFLVGVGGWFYNHAKERNGEVNRGGGVEGRKEGIMTSQTSQHC
jgi:hypothetical protein